MRPVARTLMWTLAVLGIAQFLAVFIESQLAAQASWYLVGVVALLVVGAIGEAVYARVRWS